MISDAFPALLEAAIIRYLRVGSRRPDISDDSGDPFPRTFDITRPKLKTEFIEALEEGKRKYERISGAEIGNILQFWDTINDPVGPTQTLWIGGEANTQVNRPSLIITVNTEREGTDGASYETVEGIPDPKKTVFMTAQMVWNQAGERDQLTRNEVRISIILEAVKSLIEHHDFFPRLKRSLQEWTKIELDYVEATRGPRFRPENLINTGEVPRFPLIPLFKAEENNPNDPIEGLPPNTIVLEDATDILPSIYYITPNQVELSSFRTNLSLALPPEFTEYGLLDFTVLTR